MTHCLCTWTPPPEKWRNSTVLCPQAGVAMRTDVLIWSDQAGHDGQWLISMRPQSTILKTVCSLRLVPSLLPSSPFFPSYIVYLFLSSVILMWKHLFYATGLRRDMGLCCLLVCLFGERQFHYAALAGLVLTIFLPQPPEHPPQRFSPFYLRQGPSLSLGITDLVGLAAQWASGIPLLLHPASQCWDYRPAPHTPNFTWVPGILILVWQALWQQTHLLGLILELD